MKQANRSVSFDLERNQVSQVPHGVDTDDDSLVADESDVPSRLLDTVNLRMDPLLLEPRDKEAFLQLSQDMLRFQINRKRLTRAFFQEQERQRSTGSMDPDLLAEVCRGYSLLSETEASRRARQLSQNIAREEAKVAAPCCPPIFVVEKSSTSTRRDTLSTTSSEQDADESSASRLRSRGGSPPDGSKSLKTSSEFPGSTSTTSKTTVSISLHRITKQGTRLVRRALRKR
jgi:hypothetical protein